MIPHHATDSFFCIHRGLKKGKPSDIVASPLFTFTPYFLWLLLFGILFARLSHNNARQTILGAMQFLCLLAVTSIM